MLLPLQAAAAEREFGSITGEDVRLRSEPGTESEVLAQLPLGTEVEVLGEKSGWFRVLYGETVGYVRQDLIFFSPKGSRAAYVLGDGAKLRGGPSQASYVVAELGGGQGVKVKQLIGDWYFVVAGDNVGYVHRSFLLLSRATNTSYCPAVSVALVATNRNVSALLRVIVFEPLSNVPSNVHAFGVAPGADFNR